MGKPHKHAEIIKAWADGAEIQMRCPGFENWQEMDTPTWNEVLEYRIKPEPPKYPQTKMADDELQQAANQMVTHKYGERWMIEARRVANAAIARAIEDGDVVPAAMLEKVAEAVRSELVAQVARYSTGCSTYINGETDLAAIIAKVKEGK